MTHHCKPRELTVAMAAWYDLDEAAVSYVTGSGETTNKVQSIVEDARELRAEAIESHAGDAFVGRERTDGESEEEANGDTDDGSGGDAQQTLDAGAEDRTVKDDDPAAADEEAAIDERVDEEAAIDERVDEEAVNDERADEEADGAAADDDQAGLSDFM
jgi:replication factor C large subunit